MCWVNLALRQTSSLRMGVRRGTMLVSGNSCWFWEENAQVQARRPSVHMESSWPLPRFFGSSRHLKGGGEPMIPQSESLRSSLEIQWHCFSHLGAVQLCRPCNCTSSCGRRGRHLAISLNVPMKSPGGTTGGEEAVTGISIGYWLLWSYVKMGVDGW